MEETNIEHLAPLKPLKNNEQIYNDPNNDNIQDDSIKTNFDSVLEQNSLETPKNDLESDDENYPRPKTSSAETQIESTFPTTTEGMNILLVGNESKYQRKAQSSQKQLFLQSLEKSPKPLRVHKKVYKPQRIYSSAAPLSNNEIKNICDKLLVGKKVNVEDPSHLQDVLTEFSVRRVAALEQSEYLKIKKIDDITTQLKKVFASRDIDDLFHENLNQAKYRTRQAVEAVEQTKQLWKQKEAEFKDKMKKEMYDLENKQAYQQQDLEMKWTDPSIQRRYNKQSKVLLQQKAIEKYMALTGELERAEELRKRNKETAKREVQQKFSEMQSDYESEFAKLSIDQAADHAQLVKMQELQYQTFLKNKNEALVHAEKRLHFAQMLEREAANSSNFTSKKKVIADNQPIPMATIIAKPTNVPDPAPLPLPPLQIKRIRKRNYRI